MSRRLTIQNRQRTVAADRPRLRKIVRAVLDHVSVEQFDLTIHIVSIPEITRLNETHLRHKGATDVITFDYADPAATIVKARTGRDTAKVRAVKSAATWVHGEIFVCADVALSQAKTFRTTWQSELVRYAIHGILHLLGYDDRKAAARRVMKREENRLLKEITRSFPLSKVGRQG